MENEDIIFKTTTQFRGNEYEVGFVSQERNNLQGYIQGPKKRVKFRWEQPIYERPCIYGADWRNPIVIDYVVGIIRQVAWDSICDNNPGGGGRSMDSIRQLITKGHIRRACWVTYNGDKYGILRRACLVNPEKMFTEEYKRAVVYVDLMNTLVSEHGKPIDHAEMRELFTQQEVA